MMRLLGLPGCSRAEMELWSQLGNKLTGSDAVRGTALGAVNGSLQGKSVALSADGSTAIAGALGDF